MSALSAGPSIEPAPRPVGWRTLRFTDAARDGRGVTVDIWYPAHVGDSSPSHYEPVPGISFAAANAYESAEIDPGTYPLIVLSHGRTGMRFAYAMLSEALAARGAIVVAPDHAGDAMADWLSGSFVDDRTNEINRVGDARFLLDTLLGDPARVVPAELGESLAPIAAAIDAQRIAAVGHSYGAYTALAAAAGVRGVAPDDRLHAVVGLQPYTRSMSDAVLMRVNTPTLLVLSEFDSTAPIHTDGDRPWRLISGHPAWRLDLLAASHQASSDMGLYLELAGTIPNLPPMVAAYVTMMTPDLVGQHLRPWRDGLQVQLEATWAFLDITLDIDPPRGQVVADRLAAQSGVVLQRR